MSKPANEETVMHSVSEYHVSSLVVQFKPEFQEGIAQRLTVLNNVELHGIEENGKAIVVVDGDNERSLASSIEEIRNVPGVITASIVFHRIE